MFELIRERKKLLLILLLLLVIPPFVVVGAWDRISPGTGTVVASVNGKDIYQRQWEVAHQELVDDIKQSIGQDIPEEVLNSQSAKKVTLDEMINQEILQVVTKDLNIYVPNIAVKSVIRSIPQFQTDGKFDLKKAQDFLKKRGTRSDIFEASVRNDLALRTIPAAISDTAFVPRSVARKIAQAENEDRKIRVKFFSSLSYEKDSSVSDEEVENFYDPKNKMFQIPARYDVEFILVNESDQLEEIANSVYEESDSLDPTSTTYDLKIRKANGLTFNQLLIDPSLSNDELSALNSPKFRKAFKNVEVIQDGRNTDLLEINSKLHISARLVKKYESKPIDFEVVKPQIESELKLKKMSISANKAADEWLESYNSSDENIQKKFLSQLSKPMKISRNNFSPSSLGKYETALTGKNEEIFDYKFVVNNMKVIDLGRNGSIVIYLESSQIPAPSSSVVIETLPTIYSNLKNVDSSVSYKGWLNQAQSNITVERHFNRLVSSNTSE